MTIAYVCVLIIILFPYIFAFLAKRSKRFDNHDPRNYLSTLTGWRYRAQCTQLNSLEIIPAFGIAVIIAHLNHAPQNLLNQLAVFFIISRILYAVFYLADKATARSLCWVIGIGIIIKIFFLG